MTGGTFYDEAIVVQVERELGVTLRSETMDFGTYFSRLDEDPPAMWSLSWVADYPGRNDFLGVLLGTGASNNYGRWSSPEFDAAIAEAGATGDADASAAAYDRAEAIVQRRRPGDPDQLRHGLGAVARRAAGSRTERPGILRFAGLAWAGQ